MALHLVSVGKHWYTLLHFVCVCVCLRVGVTIELIVPGYRFRTGMRYLPLHLRERLSSESETRSRTLHTGTGTSVFKLAVRVGVTIELVVPGYRFRTGMRYLPLHLRESCGVCLCQHLVRQVTSIEP